MRTAILGDHAIVLKRSKDSWRATDNKASISYVFLNAHLRAGCPVPETPPNPNATQNPASGVFNDAAGKQLPAATGRRKTVDRREPSDEPPELEADRRKPDDRRQSRQKKAAPGAKQSEAKSLAEQNVLRLAQHKRKRLLAECEAIMSVSYDILAMDD